MNDLSDTSIYDELNKSSWIVILGTPTVKAIKELLLYNIPTFLKSGNYKISHNHPISVTYILKDEIKQSGWDIMK